ncbi:hypothetical protein [uncultured Prevotella sp.]|uniref:hypothetical protein n=1 Tax=uncultured Prevotella sp. TaxID=159272 RepID=UPI00266DB7E0|nr:hypothetical protein [uncultured Prevotella sp.]
MDEHIFKMRVTKWEEGAASLHGSYDDLSPQEQNAFNTLYNLWRNAAFSDDLKNRVERQVKLLSDSDKLHNNNRDIVLASKNFRSMSRELYGTDVATLRQFVAYMKNKCGGPVRTNNRPQPTSSPRPATNNRPQPTSSPRPVTNNRPQPTSSPRPVTNNRPQPTTNHSFRPTGNSGHGGDGNDGTHFSRDMIGYAVGVMLLIGICVAMAAGWSHATASKPYDYAKWLRTEWNGETGGMPTTLIVDTVCGDSVEARLMISKAGGLVKENLKGSLEIASEGCYVYLRNSDPQTNDSSVIRLLVAQEAVRMGGSVQTSDSTSLAMSLLRAGSKEKVDVQTVISKPKQSKKNRKSQRTRKTDNSNGSYSSSSSTNTSSASHSVRNKPTEEAQPAASEPSQPDPSKGGFRLEVIKKE